MSAQAIRGMTCRAFNIEVDTTTGGRVQAEQVARNGWSCATDGCDAVPTVALNWWEPYGNPRIRGARFIRSAVCECCAAELAAGHAPVFVEGTE